MRVCSFENGGDHELWFENGRDVLQGVDDQIDSMGSEGGFELGCPEGFGLEEIESLRPSRKKEKEGGKVREGLKGRRKSKSELGRSKKGRAEKDPIELI